LSLLPDQQVIGSIPTAGYRLPGVHRNFNEVFSCTIGIPVRMHLSPSFELPGKANRIVPSVFPFAFVLLHTNKIMMSKKLSP